MNLDPTARYLFLFAHFDDDSLMAGTIFMLVEGGADVHCAWLTSCDFFGQGKQREVELADTTSMMGLTPDRLHLFRLPDLGLVSQMDHGLAMASDLMARLRPDTVFVTAFEGGHPDHDSANFLAYEGIKRSGARSRLFEFPLYNGTGPWHHWKWCINGFPPGGPPTLYNPLTERALDCKYRVMRAYSSQWMYMVPARLACRRSRMLVEGEPYRECPPDRDHTLRPHPGKVNYERWFNWFIKISFDDYRQAVSTAIRG